MDWAAETISKINVAQLLAIGALIWFFIHGLKKELDDTRKELGGKIDKLDEKVTDIDRRVCRIEGSLNAKECCLLGESVQKKRAE